MKIQEFSVAIAGFVLDHERVATSCFPLPAQVEKPEGVLRLWFQNQPEAGQEERSDGMQVLPGGRTVAYRFDGRSLLVEEEIRFDRLPSALAIQITETLHRPLSVQFHCPSPHSTSIIETAGMKDYRSYGDEIPRVHQVDIEAANEVHLQYRVTPALRVLSFHHQHYYHRTIYDELADRVVDGTTMPQCHDAHSLPPSLENWDVEYLRKRWDIFHLHWPERLDAELHQQMEIIERLAAASIPIVWTQHNLVPHSKDQRFVAIFEAWAGAASAVIHHSRWGMEQVLARHKFCPDAIHRVIPHPHFGKLGSPSATARQRIEEEFHLTPGVMRLGIVGAPREEKQVAMAIRAFITCNRDDLELLVLSLKAGDSIPEHPRVHGRRYEFVPREVYNARLSAIDLLVLPFSTQGMLTTGAVADVVGLGIPALTSDWPFLQEVLGDAGIPYGSDEAALVECLRSLDAAKIDRARLACLRLQELYEPTQIANATFQLLEMVAMNTKPV